MTWHPDMPIEYRDQIVTGDARELAQAIPDESIDLVLCDPVYFEVWQYAWLADLAGRVLKPGGSVVAQVGHIYRFEAECAMQDPRLVKRPLITEVLTGGFGTLWMHKTLNADHPYIWLEKGISKDRSWMRTMFFGRKDKQHHAWGDGVSGFMWLLDALSTPGAMICDPFAGGGTVPAACKMLGRHWVGFEIDPETAERARQRVANTPEPLFVLEPQQLNLGV